MHKNQRVHDRPQDSVVRQVWKLDQFGGRRRMRLEIITEAELINPI